MQIRGFRGVWALWVVLAFAVVSVGQSTRNTEMKPTGKGWGVQVTKPAHRQGAPAVTTGNGINYHGGPIMPGTPNIYYIWYGTWDASGAHLTNRTSDSPSTQSLLNNLITGLSGSSYEHINTTYGDNSANVSGFMALGTSVSDAYSRGSVLLDSDIQAIVAAHAGTDLPKDTNGIYFVLTSSDVVEATGFCAVYCGWHTSATINGADLKFSFVGNPDQCPMACEAQTTSPNNNSGADGMASVIAHESEEAFTDPDLNAWYDSSGNENADKCAWTFGSTSTASNGSKYNITLGGTNYLIQRNWVNASGGYCSMSF